MRFNIGSRTSKARHEVCEAPGFSHIRRTGEAGLYVLSSYLAALPASLGMALGADELPRRFQSFSEKKHNVVINVEG